MRKKENVWIRLSGFDENVAREENASELPLPVAGQSAWTPRQELRMRRGQAGVPGVEPHFGASETRIG